MAAAWEESRRCRSRSPSARREAAPALHDVPCPGRVRAVVFDFDATLTVRQELHAWRVIPGRGGFRQDADVEWLRQKGFGGASRIALLTRMLSTLKSKAVELHIVSFADREVIARALELVDLLHHFDGIAGWQDLDAEARGGGPRAKAAFIEMVMARNNWLHDDVCFVDDQASNLQVVGGVCQTLQVQGVGLAADEIEDILRRVA